MASTTTVAVVAGVSTLLLLSALSSLARPQFGSGPQQFVGGQQGFPPQQAPQGGGNEGFAGMPPPNAQGQMPPFPPQQGQGQSMQAIPPPLKALLPADVVAKLEAIHADRSIGIHEKMEQIDKVMSNLPGDLLDKIPEPPPLKNLPDYVRAKLKSINRNPNKPWADKQRELHQYVLSLPQEQKAILMGVGMRGGPPGQ